MTEKPITLDTPFFHRSQPEEALSISRRHILDLVILRFAPAPLDCEKIAGYLLNINEVSELEKLYKSAFEAKDFLEFQRNFNK